MVFIYEWKHIFKCRCQHVGSNGRQCGWRGDVITEGCATPEEALAMKLDVHDMPSCLAGHGDMRVVHDHVFRVQTELTCLPDAHDVTLPVPDPDMWKHGHTRDVSVLYIDVESGEIRGEKRRLFTADSFFA